MVINGYNCNRGMHRGMDMIELLFLLNIGIAFVILLTTSMIQTHFKRIHRNVERYADKKTYKPHKSTQFITTLLDRYSVISGNMGTKVDVGVLVTKTFYEERVGKFRYTCVESIAIRGKVVMWAILICQIGIELVTKVAPYPKKDIIFIIATTLICMIITLVGVIKGIREEREKLLVKLADYIVNTYPAEKEWQKQQEDIKKLHEKIDHLKEELHSYQEPQNIIPIPEHKAESKEEDKDLLKEKDIISLLDKFNLI